MEWTAQDLAKINAYATLIVSGKMSMDKVPEKYKVAVQDKVDKWFD